MLVQIECDSALNIPPGIRDFLVSNDFRLPIDIDESPFILTRTISEVCWKPTRHFPAVHASGSSVFRVPLKLDQNGPYVVEQMYVQYFVPKTVCSPLRRSGEC